MKIILPTRKLCIALLLFCALGSYAQRFDSILFRLNNEYKQEKIYLHFDRNLYSPGETIWFKAYLFTGSYPSLVSKTIYAELLDEKGKIIQRKTAPVLSSSAAAAFDIPAGLTGSVVYIRAYTRWMLNFDSSFIFYKAIPLASLKKPEKNGQVPAISIHFFPEGGDLVEGVLSRVAFKANDDRGMPVNISGDIVDNNGDKVLSFKSEHDGMGSFGLVLKPGERYKAIWKDEKGKIRETVLPAAKQDGIVLEVTNNATQIEFKLRRSENRVPPYPFVYVVAQMNQQLLYRAKANIGKIAAPSGAIPIDNLPAGIVQVTIFTPDEKPIAERITFINHSSFYFITDLNMALQDAGKKKKNVIQVDVPDTIPCNLSISVTDADLDPLQESDNIFSSLLLTSDIKGYVHRPAYYFTSAGDSVEGHLDLVMMTNGWRRFNWESVLANQWPKLTYQPDNYLAIQGQVSGLNKTLLTNREINAVIEFTNKQREFLNTPVSIGGKFIFPDMIFYDTAKLFYQFNNDKKKDLTARAGFDIKNGFLKDPLQLKPDSILLWHVTKTDTATLAKNIEIYKEELSEQELKKVKTLKEITIKGKQKTKQEVMDAEYASGLFSGGDSRTILPEDDPAFLSSQSVLDFLRGRYAGLQVSVGNPATVSWRGSATTLFMNEMEQEAEVIQNIPMSDIAMVKIFNPPFFGAMGGGPGGAVAIYLKKGAAAYQSVKGLDYISVPGYSPIKEFYSPDYSNPNAYDSTDLRKTLYWNPFVVTDKKTRRIFLPFFNNDITRRMKIIIEGCNEDGKLTRVEKLIR